jgi:hypothetical protein
VLRELTGSQVALGDVLLGARDAAASTDQYRKALATAERLGGLAGNAADARREIDAIRQRLQAAPPPPAP